MHEDDQHEPVKFRRDMRFAEARTHKASLRHIILLCALLLLTLLAIRYVSSPAAKRWLGRVFGPVGAQGKQPASTSAGDEEAGP